MWSCIPQAKYLVAFFIDVKQVRVFKAMEEHLLALTVDPPYS